MTMRRDALQFLFIISVSTSTSWVPENPFKCFEHDYPPVDSSVAFDKYCKDNHGNIYKPSGPEDPAQLKSCCECLDYRCAYIGNSKILYWKTSVSDHCCLACTNTTYKADTVIETIEFDDKCKSIETQVCRKLPGHEKAKIESEFNYKACCNDNTGLQVLDSKVYQPSTCSQRTCFYDKYLPFSLWISKQVVPGCDCCLRTDPKTGKEYLVADGTTWAVHGKVFECCRGDIVMKTEPHTTSHTIPHSTTTRKPTPASDNVVLITGGYNTRDLNTTQHSAEIFLPNSPGNPCILPDLPERYYAHTQDSGMICGGSYTKYTCRQWSPKEESFPDKPVHYFKPGRFHHVSWTTAEKETILFGGGAYNTGARNSTTILKPGVVDGNQGFKLGDQIYGACSIPWPEKNSVVITGGNYHSPIYMSTPVYNEKGFVEDLGKINHQRVYHGCTSYIANKKRIFLVTGGQRTSSSEILQDKQWSVLPNGNLPNKIYGLGLATVNNEVFAFGGYVRGERGRRTVAFSSIFKFNIGEGKWQPEKYKMSRGRYFFGISVVDFKYYSEACLK